MVGAPLDTRRAAREGVMAAPLPDLPNRLSREEIEAAARANENVLRFTEGLSIRKVIVVPGKLVNIVAN